MAAQLSGEWLSSYSYHDSQNASQHRITFEGEAELTGRSLPQLDGSELTLHLTYDAQTNTLTGTWYETTSPQGAYKGAAFHGALQLILNDIGNKANGKWVGYDSGLARVNSGDWWLEKQQI